MGQLSNKDVERAIAVAAKAEALVGPAQAIFGLAKGAVSELQKPSTKSKKSKVIVHFAKQATAVAADAKKQHEADKLRKTNKARK